MTAQVQVNDTGSTVTVTITESPVSVGVPSAVSHNALSGRSTASAHPATALDFTPTGTLASTTVQAAIAELDTECVHLAGTETITGAKTFTDALTAIGASGIIDRQAATQDGIQLLGRAGGTSSYLGTLTTAALSASRTATFPDDDIGVQSETEEKTGNFTARVHGQYVATATLTVTDPTPSQGHEFVVHVRNGTATVGGVAYAAGQTIWRSYHSGAWSNTVIAALDTAQTFSALQTFAAGLSLTGSVVTATNSSNAALVHGFTASSSGTSASVRVRVTNDASTGLSIVSRSSTNSGTLFGVAAANRVDLIGTGASLSALVIGTDAVTAPIVFGINASEVARLTSTGASFLQPITVPNGTAAAPGLRLTSEASGLYRVSSTSLGFAVAGSGVASLTSGQVFTVGLGSGAVTASIVINGTAGQTRQFAWQSAGVDRWHLRADSTAESGSDAGSLFVLSARTDAGALIDNPLSIVRASGGAITLARPVACSNATASTSTTTGALTVAGGLGVAGAAFFGGDVTRTGSSTAQIEYLIQNTGTGTTSRSRYRVANAAGDAVTTFSVYNATNTQSTYGFSLANWSAYECGGASVNGLVIGCASVDKPIVFGINASEEGRIVEAGGGWLLGQQAALATNATKGFAYIRGCAGTPTGAPTAYTGMVPLCVDTTNHKLYFYSGGAWRDAGP